MDLFRHEKYWWLKISCFKTYKYLSTYKGNMSKQCGGILFLGAWARWLTRGRWRSRQCLMMMTWMQETDRAFRRSRSLSHWTQHFRFYRRTNPVPGPLLPHSRGYTITDCTILAALVAPVCILIAIYLGLWCLDFSTLRSTYRSLFLNCIIYKLGALGTY